jgi:hypothetical protein
MYTFDLICSYHRGEKGRGEIGGVYSICMPSHLERDGTYIERKGEGACTPHPHQAGLNLPSWWNVRQKVAIANLFELSVFHTVHTVM